MHQDKQGWKLQTASGAVMPLESNHATRCKVTHEVEESNNESGNLYYIINIEDVMDYITSITLLHV